MRKTSRRERQLVKMPARRGDEEDRRSVDAPATLWLSEGGWSWRRAPLRAARPGRCGRSPIAPTLILQRAGSPKEGTRMVA